MYVTDSQMLSLVKQEVMSRIYLATHLRPSMRYTDSMCRRSRKLRRDVMRLADEVIRYHDARHNDFIGFALFKNIFCYMVLPWLIDFAKGIVAGGITSSFKQKMVDPVLDKLIGSGKALMSKKDENEPQTQALIRNIKDGMARLWELLKREGSFVAGKVFGFFSKIKNAI